MADWIYGSNGQANIIHDNDCFRNKGGQVIAWINRNSVYSLSGLHVGWFDDGVLYDSDNNVIGFLRDCTGGLPSRPGIGGTPGTPGFCGRPGRPGLRGVPGRPGRGGWSTKNLANYFTNN